MRLAPLLCAALLLLLQLARGQLCQPSGSSAIPPRYRPLPPADANATRLLASPPGAYPSRPHPRGYVALRCASGALAIDGHLDEPEWLAAPWSDKFVDITGDERLRPRYDTRVKMLWSDDALYVGAEMQEPQPWANLTLHDSVVFKDNDFEIFLDVDGDNHLYMELEVNALGTLWDLLLVKPYRVGGPPLMSWESVAPNEPTQPDGPSGWAPLRRAVWVNGTLNDGTTPSHGWSVEFAIPWSIISQVLYSQSPPRAGDQFRINFSRVEYRVRWDAATGRYRKDPPDQAESNWVWSPQYLINMHMPEQWGYLQFSDQQALDAGSGHNGQAAGGSAGVQADAPPHAAAGHSTSGTHPTAGSAAASAVSTPFDGVEELEAPWRRPPPAFPPRFDPDPSWPLRTFLMDVFYVQADFEKSTGRYSKAWAELGVEPPAPPLAERPVLEATQAGFLVSGDVRLPGGGTRRCYVDEQSKLTCVQLGGSKVEEAPSAVM